MHPATIYASPPGSCASISGIGRGVYDETRQKSARQTGSLAIAIAKNGLRSNLCVAGIDAAGKMGRLVAMEESGSIYLFNLSIVAITFTAVSALVMLVRQTMGGKLSNFDVYLITSFVSFGFAQSLSAILPSLISLFEPPHHVLWAGSSGSAALLLGATLFSIVRRRMRVSSDPIANSVFFAFCLQGLAVTVLVVNAVITAWQGVHLFAGAVTLSVAVIMWAFVRRIASLLGDQPGEDWDPKQG